MAKLTNWHSGKRTYVKYQDVSVEPHVGGKGVRLTAGDGKRCDLTGLNPIQFAMAIISQTPALEISDILGMDNARNLMEMVKLANAPNRF